MSPPPIPLAPALRAAQSECGHLPPELLRALAARLEVPLYRLQEVVSFFPQSFRTAPPHPEEFLVCCDMSCQLAGADDVLKALRDERRQTDPGATQVGQETGPGARVGARPVVRQVHCLGRCDRAPVVAVEQVRATSGPLQPAAVAARAALRAWSRTPVPHDAVVFWQYPCGADPRPADDSSLPTNRPWEIDRHTRERPPSPFETVRALASDLARERVGWTGLRAATRPTARVRRYEDIDPHLKEANYLPSVRRVLRELDVARLRGMGGGGKPAFEKWLDVLMAEPGTKYVVANGDESEPGAFKDRELMLRAPHLVVEGVVIAGLVLGAERGYVYVRHEYPDQIRALQQAIDELPGAGIRFPVEVVESPGGYVCGEQSALIEAMQDRRAQPRPKPPEPATNGLWDRPTLLSNVETFAWVPAVVRLGGAEYARLGRRYRVGEPTERTYSGKRFFSVSGDVQRPGVFEVPIGATLGELIALAGGTHPGHTLKAVAPGGASGGFVPAEGPPFPVRLPSRIDPRGLPPTVIDRLEDMPLDIDDFRDLARACPGATLATGLVVFDDRRNIAEAAVNCLRFFRDESCGKCVPCRIGTEKLLELGTRLVAGQRVPAGLAEVSAARAVEPTPLEELAEVMGAASICSLGASAPAPLLSLLRFFRADLPAPAAGSQP